MPWKNQVLPNLHLKMKKISLLFIKIYRLTLSPIFVFLWGHQCRHLPTCSEYTHEAVKKYGILKGGVMGAKRVLSCNPFVAPKYQPVK